MAEGKGAVLRRSSRPLTPATPPSQWPWERSTTPFLCLVPQVPFHSLASWIASRSFFDVETSRNSDHATDQTMQSSLVRLRSLSIECRPLEIEQNRMRSGWFPVLTCCRHDVANNVNKKFLWARSPKFANPLIISKLYCRRHFSCSVRFGLRSR